MSWGGAVLRGARSRIGVFCVLLLAGTGVAAHTFMVDSLVSLGWNGRRACVNRCGPVWH